LSAPASRTADESRPLLTLALAGESLAAALAAGDGVLSRQALPDFLPAQRWFGAKDSPIRSVALSPLGQLDGGHLLAVADVTFESETQRYLLPLSALEAGAVDARRTPALAALPGGRVLVDSALLPALDSALLNAMREGRRIGGAAGDIVFEGSAALAAIGDPGQPKPLGAEQSNVSIGFGGKVILKLYRRLRAGEQPDVEVARFLTETAHYEGAPPLLGEIRYETGGAEPTTLAAAFAFVANRGDAWTAITAALADDLAASGDTDRAFPHELAVGGLLGRRTAEMHRALATATDDPAFTVEPLTPDDTARWSDEAEAEAQAVLRSLERRLVNLPPDAAALAHGLLEQRTKLTGRLEECVGMAPSGGRSRIHGDYHLGQVLATNDDFVIIDFEGEPRRSLAERRAKSSPLRDVAGMLRSFHYAAHTALEEARKRGAADAAGRAERWRRETGEAFMAAYHAHAAGIPSYPPDAAFARALADLFLLQKAVYEIGYELANRPAWIGIPLQGMLDLLSGSNAAPATA
jgi:trehalose synthase-fused probable maltokinase